MNVRITSKGDFNRTFKFLEKMKNFQVKLFYPPTPFLYTHAHHRPPLYFMRTFS